jgi:hypothetical protein
MKQGHENLSRQEEFKRLKLPAKNITSATNRETIAFGAYSKE